MHLARARIVRCVMLHILYICTIRDVYLDDSFKRDGANKQTADKEGVLIECTHVAHGEWHCGCIVRERCNEIIVYVGKMDTNASNSMGALIRNN